MSRFHFDEAVMSATASELSNAAQNIASCSVQVQTAVSSIASASGFSIGDIVSDINFEVTKLTRCSDALLEGEKSIRKIIDAVKNYERKAVSFKTADKSGNYEFEGGVCAPKSDDSKVSSVLSNSDNSNYENNIGVGSAESNTVPDNQDNSPENQTVGQTGWIRDDGRYEYAISSNTHVIRDTETGGDINYEIVPAVDLFGDWNGGFVQTRSSGNPNGWFASTYQCVATAKATTAVYNGGDPNVVTPHAYYSESDYWKGEKGCAVGCSWSKYGDMSAEQFLSTIKGKLYDGKASTIYAHKDESHNTGHAVTVVGYVNGGNSIYDLVVIDPWSGKKYRLGDCYNTSAQKGFNGYFTLDYSD